MTHLKPKLIGYLAILKLTAYLKNRFYMILAKNIKNLYSVSVIVNVKLTYDCRGTLGLELGGVNGREIETSLPTNEARSALQFSAQGAGRGKKKHLQTYARKCVSQPCLKPESRTRAFKRRRFMFSEVAQKSSIAATKTARLCAAFIWLLYVMRAVLRGKLIVLEEEKNDQMASNDVAGGGAQKDQRKAVEPSRSSEGTLVGTS